MHSELFADGSHFEAAIVPGGGSRYPDADGEGRKPKIAQDGHSIFRLAVRGMSQTVKHSLSAAGLEAERLDWLIPHQANQRIMDAVAEQLSFPSKRMISTISHIGNNSAATIPIALDIAVRDGRILRGQHVMLTAFGGGVAWGSVLLQY
jgi:3-oxoacyl-[acyl-carrier-protein] synthase-3